MYPCIIGVIYPVKDVSNLKTSVIAYQPSSMLTALQPSSAITETNLLYKINIMRLLELSTLYLF
jgi:hypothetical protein